MTSIIAHTARDLAQLLHAGTTPLSPALEVKARYAANVLQVMDRPDNQPDFIKQKNIETLREFVEACEVELGC